MVRREGYVFLVAVELHEERVSVEAVVVNPWEACASASDVRLHGGQVVSRREEAALEPVRLGALRHGKDLGKELGRPIGQELIVQVGGAGASSVDASMRSIRSPRTIVSSSTLTLRWPYSVLKNWGVHRPKARQWEMASVTITGRGGRKYSR